LSAISGLEEGKQDTGVHKNSEKHGFLLVPIMLVMRWDYEALSDLVSNVGQYCGPFRVCRGHGFLAERDCRKSGI
jgi:hypothetical protein